MSAPQWSRQPLSSPAWLWLTYCLLIFVLARFAGNAWPCVVIAAGFSFQFWTFAAWRGASRKEDA